MSQDNCQIREKNLDCLMKTNKNVMKGSFAIGIANGEKKEKRVQYCEPDA